MASITNHMANPEIEQAVLGLIIQSGGNCDSIFNRLTGRDFSDKKHREVYRAMQDMHMQHKAIDFLTLSEAHPELDTVYLIDLLQKAPVTTVVTDSYVEILKACTARRDFDTLGSNIRKECAEDDFDAVKLTEKIRLWLKNMGQTDGEETDIKDDIMEMYDAVYEKPENSQGIMLKLPALDAATKGLKAGRMYVIGARPSVGKTVFGINAALKAALEGKPVLYINREMEKVDMLKRMTANLSGLNMNSLEGQNVGEEHFDKLMDTITLLNKLPIHISNRARTPAQIRAKAVEIQEKQGLGLVVVDYLQRMSAGERYKSRDEEIGSISMALKDMAMDLRIPVVLLSQLNRSASNTRPNMAMLRESGNIEQDADVVILLHAPDPDAVPEGRRQDYMTIRKDRGRYLEMIVDKNRHGQTGIIPVAFFGDYMRYVPLKERET